MSDFLSHVGERSQVPFRAILLSVIIQVLLGLINIGSYFAFSAFVNSAAVTLYITYIVPVILGLLKRMRGEHIYSIGAIPARKVAGSDQHPYHHLHSVHVVLSALAG